MKSSILTLAFVAGANAQRITSLPGLSKLPPFAMSAGYVNYTSPSFGTLHSTFHWIVESAGNPAVDPILFWSNGGPGVSCVVPQGIASDADPARISCLYEFAWRSSASRLVFAHFLSLPLSSLSI